MGQNQLAHSCETIDRQTIPSDFIDIILITFHIFQKYLIFLLKVLGNLTILPELYYSCYRG